MADSTDTATRCEQCGDPVDESTDRRVVSSVEDGIAVHLHFCNGDCLEQWSQ